jgi:predicted transposase/invertase (TIGR01784 family)
MREKYINPFTDFGFKKIFGTEYNKDLLIDFLNQVLGDREQIKDLTYLNSEKLGKTQSDRKAIFDLYCENEQGDKFIIELQNVPQQYFKDRSVFYAI